MCEGSTNVKQRCVSQILRKVQRPCWSSRALRPVGHTARKLGAGAGVRTSAHAWRTHTPQGAGTYQAAKYQTTYCQAPDDRRSLCPRLPDMPRTCMTSSTGAWTRVQPSAFALESSPPRHRIIFAFKRISCVSCQAGVSTPAVVRQRDTVMLHRLSDQRSLSQQRVQSQLLPRRSRSY